MKNISLCLDKFLHGAKERDRERVRERENEMESERSRYIQFGEGSINGPSNRERVGLTLKLTFNDL